MKTHWCVYIHVRLQVWQRLSNWKANQMISSCHVMEAWLGGPTWTLCSQLICAGIYEPGPWLQFSSKERVITGTWQRRPQLQVNFAAYKLRNCLSLLQFKIWIPHFPLILPFHPVLSYLLQEEFQAEDTRMRNNNLHFTSKTGICKKPAVLCGMWINVVSRSQHLHP